MAKPRFAMAASALPDRAASGPSKSQRSSRHGSAEIPAACRTAAHRRGCDASTTRPACIPWPALPRPPIAPFARRCRGCGNALATRTSSIRAREAPCELSPGRMQSCRQPTTAPSLLRDHELDIRIAVERLECPEIGRRQRILDPFAPAAERIVRQHATMTPTSSRRARRMVTGDIAVIMLPVISMRRRQAERLSRSRRSSAATRHSRRGESRLHAPAAYRPAARRRRARQLSPTRNRVAASWCSIRASAA